MISQSHLGFIIDHADHIMDLVSEWFPYGIFRNLDTTLCAYDKYPVASIPMMGEAPWKAKHDYHGKSGHTLVNIQHISIMSIIDICYMVCHLGAQIVSPVISVFQGIKIVYNFSNHTQKPIFY